MKVHCDAIRSIDTIDDTEWSEAHIDRVESGDGGWSVTHDGWSLWVADNGIEPEVGDTLRMYGRGIGFQVRGIALNGVVVRYESSHDMSVRQEREQRERDAERKANALANRDETNARIAALPQNFQDRIAGFRQRNPDFDWDHMPYELMCCEQAVLFAKTFPNVDALKTWHELPYEKQKSLCPGLDEGHSGNSFGAACRLAYLHLTNPELIPQEHGALCPLVGCRDYGCWSTTLEEAA